MTDAAQGTDELPAQRTMVGILDHAFDVMRSRRGPIALVAIAVVLPLSAVMLVLQIQSVGLDAVGDPFGGFDDGGRLDTTLAVTAVLVSSLQVTLMAGALTPLVERPGQAVTASELAGRLLRRLPSILAGWVLVKLLQLAGAFGLIVGAFFVMIFCSLVTPIIAAETANPVRAIGRSFRLVSKGFGRTIGVVVLMVVVDSMVRLSFIAVPTVVATWTTWSLGPTLVAVVSVVTELISASFVALATATLYVDLRVRVDQLHLQRRFEAAGVAW